MISHPGKRTYWTRQCKDSVHFAKREKATWPARQRLQNLPRLREHPHPARLLFFRQLNNQHVKQFAPSPAVMPETVAVLSPCPNTPLSKLDNVCRECEKFTIVRRNLHLGAYTPAISPPGAAPMLYLFAVILPPIALLGAKKPFQAIFALILMITILGWIPAAIWAVMVVNQSKAEQRQKELIEAQRLATEAQTAALLAAQQAASSASEPAMPSPPTPPTA